MNNGLGHFLIVSFNQPVNSWKDEVLGSKQAIKKISLREENLFDITSKIKAIAHGDVKLTHYDSAERSEFCLSAIFGKTSIEDFIVSGAEGFYGKFALVKIDHQSGEIKAYTDATRQINLYWLSFNGINAVSTDIRLFSYIPGYTPEINPESIYHHLNFAYIPTPFSIYKNIKKIGPGNELTIYQGKGSLRRYWMPVYQEDLVESEDSLVKKLNEEIVNTIKNYSTHSDNTACFLSGGTDSSTITGVTSRNVGGENTHGYSIGFDEKGYDELEYAEIAAKAFNINHHARRIGNTETLSAINLLIDSFDEPFGNSSAIPTYYCALLAKENGHNILLGGDGGDEIFGGNERYAKDYYFNLFYSLPKPIKSIASYFNTLIKPVDTRFINRVNNYIYRASLPNPERFYTDDSFGSEYFDTLLSAELRDKIDIQSSLHILHDHYDQCQAKSELNKLMYIDLQMAIADNDLTKVNRAAAAADVSVMYPYLSPDLISFMGHIPSKYKVNKTQKRYLFKKAVSDILPIDIQKKKKQGFGLPVGEWFREDKQFKELLNDTLLSQRSIERGYFNKSFIQGLISKHEKGSWDYTQELWLLLILELWHQEYVDA
jgi:asparagine synthase (glutamine-hydrolysing)